MNKFIRYSITAFALCYSVCSVAKGPIDVSFKEKDYEILSFSDITPNEYKFDGNALTIKVDSSAAPLIYPLKEPQAFNKLMFSAKQTGKLSLKDSTQGAKNNDDFTLKIGLVFEGDKKLNFFQRTVAATWIKKLYSLAPKGTGISNIYFYSVYQDDDLKGEKRQHPLSDLIYEEYVSGVDENGDITVNIDIESDKKVLALWISADGDDTQSSFDIKINSIVLE